MFSFQVRKSVVNYILSFHTLITMIMDRFPYLKYKRVQHKKWMWSVVAKILYFVDGPDID